MQGVYGHTPTTIEPVGPGTAVYQYLRDKKLHKNPKMLGVGFLWLFGLFAIFLSPAPVTLTEERLARFEEKLNILDKADKPRQAAEQAWIQAEQDVSKSKEWFWRFKSSARERVHKKQAIAKEKQKRYAQLDKDVQRKVSDAKAELGLWSEAGVGEGRKLFWNAFESGKVFGRRQTFWDAFLTLLTSREEGVLGMIVQLIIQAMINFTTGMVASIFIFIFQLPSFLWSYRPNLISGLAFFLIAAIGALSVVASFLLAMYGAGATAVFTIASLNPNMRISFGRRNRAAHLRHHYD